MKSEKKLVCHKCEKKTDFKLSNTKDAIESGWIDWSFCSGMPDLTRVRFFLCPECQEAYDSQLREVSRVAKMDVNKINRDFLNLDGYKRTMGFNVYKEE